MKHQSLGSECPEPGEVCQSPAKENLPNILIVDPKPIDTIVNFLDSLPSKTTIVSHGNDALALCRKCNFDLVLIEINLPDISGIKLTGNIRKKKIPFVYLTHEVSDAVVDAGLASAPISYIAKMSQIDSILIQIKSALQHAQRLQVVDQDIRNVRDSARVVNTAVGHVSSYCNALHNETLQALENFAKRNRIELIRVSEEINRVWEEIATARNSLEGIEKEYQMILNRVWDVDNNRRR